MIRKSYFSVLVFLACFISLFSCNGRKKSVDNDIEEEYVDSAYEDEKEYIGALAFYELHGPVKKVIKYDDEGWKEYLYFDRKGKYIPFDEFIVLYTDEKDVAQTILDSTEIQIEDDTYTYSFSGIEADPYDQLYSYNYDYLGRLNWIDGPYEYRQIKYNKNSQITNYYYSDPILVDVFSINQIYNEDGYLQKQICDFLGNGWNEKHDGVLRPDTAECGDWADTEFVGIKTYDVLETDSRGNWTRRVCHFERDSTEVEEMEERKIIYYGPGEESLSFDKLRSWYKKRKKAKSKTPVKEQSKENTDNQSRLSKGERALLEAIAAYGENKNDIVRYMNDLDRKSKSSNPFDSFGLQQTYLLACSAYDNAYNNLKRITEHTTESEYMSLVNELSGIRRALMACPNYYDGVSFDSSIRQMLKDPAYIESYQRPLNIFERR